MKSIAQQMIRQLSVAEIRHIKHGDDTIAAWLVNRLRSTYQLTNSQADAVESRINEIVHHSTYKHI